MCSCSTAVTVHSDLWLLFVPVLLVTSLEPHMHRQPLPDLITFMVVMDFFYAPSLTDSEIGERNCLYLFSVVFQLYSIMLRCVTFHHLFLKSYPVTGFVSREQVFLSRSHVYVHVSRTCVKYLMTSSFKNCGKSHFCTIVGFLST